MLADIVAGGATTLPDPSHFSSVGWVVVILVGLVMGARAVIGLWRDLQKPSGPEQREVKMMASAVERSVFEAHVVKNEREHENIFSKLGGVDRGGQERLEKKFEQLRNERTHDMEQLHSDLGQVSNKVSALDKMTELQNQRLAQMDTKLDRLIERKSLA